MGSRQSGQPAAGRLPPPVVWPSWVFLAAACLSHHVAMHSRQKTWKHSSTTVFVVRVIWPRQIAHWLLGTLG
jgi:hypothetical protein